MGRKDEPEISPEQLLAYLKRTLPYLPGEVRDRQPGSHPAIDAAAPWGDRLGHLILQRSEMGPGRWQALMGAAIPVAQQLVAADIGLFEELTRLRAAERLQTRGSLPEEALEVFQLYGLDVAGKVANEVWQFGYAGCMARLFLKAERDGTSFPHPSSDLPVVQDLAYAARCAPLDVWVDAGTEPPLTGALALEALWYLSDQMFKRLYPLYGPENEREGRGRLRGLAVWGYAIGRAHLEQAVLGAALR